MTSFRVAIFISLTLFNPLFNAYEPISSPFTPTRVHDRQLGLGVGHSSAARTRDMTKSSFNYNIIIAVGFAARFVVVVITVYRCKETYAVVADKIELSPRTVAKL